MQRTVVRFLFALVLGSIFIGAAVYMGSRLLKDGSSVTHVVSLCVGFFLLGVIAAAARKRVLDAGSTGRAVVAMKRAEYEPSLSILWMVAIVLSLAVLGATLLGGEEWFMAALASVFAGFAPGYALWIPEDRIASG